MAKTKSKVRRKNKHSSDGSRKPLYGFLALVIILGGLIAGVMTNSAFAGGWEATSQGDEFQLKTTRIDETYSWVGDHEDTKDPDGDFDYQREVGSPNPDLEPTNYECPGITVKASYPFYIERLADGTWVLSDTAWLLDEYQINATSPEGDPQIFSYKHWTIGIDVTMQTAATSYYKPGINPSGLGYSDYGYYYEDDVVDITTETTFGITPWTPAGVSNNWTVTGGWSGIMSASVIEVEYGLIQDEADENKGHTIQNIPTVGQPVNMDGEVEVDFNDPAALVGVPSSVDFELSSTLAAGAEYTTDGLGHWDSIAVRNVYVKSRVRIDVVSTLIWTLKLGHQVGLEKPDENNTAYQPEITENNTAYQPEITPWKQFWENLNSFFNDPFTRFMLIVIVLAVGGVVLVYMKFRDGDPES
ncbi:MAG: hypothetical protein ACW977_02980 [Candidatus Thorarchaeota archaeon]